jgi:formylglycine-generating enzyme required for sulfatase activity
VPCVCTVVVGILVPGCADEAKHEKVAEYKDPFTNSVGMKFVRVKAGKFMMGSPKGEKDRNDDEAQHEVEITKDYYLGVTEVTQKQYRTIMGYNPSFFSHDGKPAEKGTYPRNEPGGGKDKVKGLDTDDFPVENVSWEEAQEFIEKLNALAAERKFRVTYRLPTEAQWEYACRGGHLMQDKKEKAQFPFHFEMPSASLGSGQANFNAEYPYGDGTKGDHSRRTNTVGRNGEANALGLFDMHGNVSEYCEDWYSPSDYDRSPPTDPTGPVHGSGRVCRGGGWDDNGRLCRAAFRGGVLPSYRFTYLGFRVAATPQE